MVLKKNKKSQVKIQEMSFMLLALVLFFIIAGIFFIVITNANLRKSAESLGESEAILTISGLAASPELSCGSESLCVDTDKLIALRGKDAFRNYWDVDGGLVVKKLYPYNSEEIECNARNYDTCNTYTLKPRGEGYKGIGSYVTLCRKEVVSGYSYDKCEIGRIIAYVE
jgi:uncharacterized protein YjeT (DUF2065 family)